MDWYDNGHMSRGQNFGEWFSIEKFKLKFYT